jgi:hypothetical protein
VNCRTNYIDWQWHPKAQSWPATTLHSSSLSIKCCLVQRHLFNPCATLVSKSDLFMVVICVVSVDMLIIYIGKTISEGEGFTKNTPIQFKMMLSAETCSRKCPNDLRFSGTFCSQSVSSMFLTYARNAPILFEQFFQLAPAGENCSNDIRFWRILFPVPQPTYRQAAAVQ